VTDLARLSLDLVRSPGYVNLTTRQWAILALLCDEPGPHGVAALARTLGVGKPIITRSHHRMAGLGLVQRVAHPHDRRKASVMPTEQGRALRERVAGL
jgi:DNA-binding MarR family transcriptional regulator